MREGTRGSLFCEVSTEKGLGKLKRGRRILNQGDQERPNEEINVYSGF